MTPDADPRRPDDMVAPETVNPEQEDEEAQAQSVADAALRRDSGGVGLSDSEKVATGSDFDDVPDLIDRMEQMDSSGIIDMGAYRGEPNDDDEPDSLGPDGARE